MKAQTRLAIAGQKIDRCYNSVVPPLYQTAIFRFEDVGKSSGYDYTRSGNPTRNALEETLAELDGGAGAVATTSGMAAISTVLSTLPARSHVVCTHDCYGGTERLLHRLETLGKVDVSFVDLTDPSSLEEHIRSETKLLWIETPSNPLLRVYDVRALSRIAKEKGILVVVDNTFLSPLFQQSIDLGADYVVYSTTKYINGHSDVVGGAVVAATDELNDEIQFTANAFGTIAGPFDCWLVLRGLKTLPLRLQQHESNALAVARYLHDHPSVRRTFYPGLESHSGYELASRQQKGFGGMVSFELDGGFDDVRSVLQKTQIFTLAESLGGVESLIEHPASMSHASMREERRFAAGITDGIVRLSVGIEDPDDLILDLEHALDANAAPDDTTRAPGVPLDDSILV
jgi:O-succinylhomoserine (thiol)-lyase